MKKTPIYILFAFFLLACNSTKYVADGKFMLAENKFFIDSAKTGAPNLQKYVLQKPNAKFLGLPIGLYLYNLGNPNKPKTPKKWGEKNPNSYNFIKSIFSEKQSIAYANAFINLNKSFLDYPKPEILNLIKINGTANNLLAYYKTQGYFKSSIQTIIKRDSLQKKATVSYYLNKGKPTTLDTIKIRIESPILDSIYRNSGMNSLLKTGDQYNDQTFRNEAEQVVKLFKNSGIYHFTEAAIGFYVDSTRTDYKTNVDYIISGNRIDEDANGNYVDKPFKIHKIKSVNVTTDYSFSKKDSNTKDTMTYNGINYFAFNKIKYNPKYLSQSLFLLPGDTYKDSLNNLTRTHLKSLKNFKSTTIKFTPDKENSSNLHMDVLLSPIEKYTLGFETELTHSNIRNIGTSAKFSLTNRNTFKGAELLKLSVLGSWFDSNAGPGWEIGADISLEIPRFLAPFGLSKLVPKRMSPRTLISLGTSIQENIGLDRQTLTLLADLRWQYNQQKTINLELFNLQYIQNLNNDSYFNIFNSEYRNLNQVAQTYFNDPTRELSIPEEVLSFMETVASDTDFRNSNPQEFNTNLNILNRYNIITSDFLIPTIAYTYTYNNQSNFKDNNFSFFKIRVANSGSFLGFLSTSENENDKTTFFDIPLAQYFKTDIEYKKFWDIGNNNSVIGFRTFVGAIFTYNNADIPFVKSYFAGGSNDIRAWQTYELGPGSRNTGLEFNVGSFKFLTSAEYRFDIVSRLKGALFVDAGNIWDISGSPFVEEGAKLTNFSSLQNIAVGSGFGARLDFSFLILRFDVGFKTYEPYLEGNKWFKNYDFQNAVYNIGINYPF